MKIIEPSYIIEKGFGDDAVEFIEKIARTCYKSEDNISENSASRMVKSLINREHEAMLEHVSMTVRFIHNRGFTHEMVRMRLCSFAQESTRYCNYTNEGVKIIQPYWISTNDEKSYLIWLDSMKNCEKTYIELINYGLKPQATRGVLPIDVKTEIVVTANLREWRHIFRLRCAKDAHPDMLRVMCPLLREMLNTHRDFFYDLDKLKDNDG